MQTLTFKCKADDTVSLRNRLRELSIYEGFSNFGVCSPNSISQYASYLHKWLSQGYHGNMEWMLSGADRRADPTTLWPEVKSIIMLADNYTPKTNPLNNHPKINPRQATRGEISVYARNRDYHDTIKKRLKRIAGWLHKETSCDVKVFVDTAPVMEKPLALSANLGWIGKHTNLVSKSTGSWFFLGAIFTTATLPTDTAATDHCGSCSKCIDICPTDAFTAPYQLDARRCISYLTIELKGHIPLELRPLIGNKIYGCDDCLAICPWNKFAQTASESAYIAREELCNPSLSKLALLNESEFRKLFTKSPVKRIGYAGFMRNVLTAIGNSKDTSLISSVCPYLNNTSDIVSEAAQWAFARLTKHG